MAFCSKCGTSITDGTAFCPQCGAPAGPMAMGTPVAAPVTGPAVTPTVSGISENVAGLLCYLLGWLTGLIFLLIDKRPFVRFHAAQSIVVFGTLFIIRLVLSFGLIGMHLFGLFGLWTLLSLLLSIVTLVAWVVLMVTAYQGKRLEVPVAAGFAKRIAAGSTV